MFAVKGEIAALNRDAALSADASADLSALPLALTCMVERFNEGHWLVERDALQAEVEGKLGNGLHPSSWESVIRCLTTRFPVDTEVRTLLRTPTRHRFAINYPRLAALWASSIGDSIRVIFGSTSTLREPTNDDELEWVEWLTSFETSLSIGSTPAGRTASMRDVFISYAREDEESLVRPLAEEFGRRGLTLWLDRFDLRQGRAIEDEIQAGVLASRYAVVVISRSFLEKPWPKRELDILLTLEAIDDRRRIVTVRHALTHTELRRLAPPLADRTTISSETGPAQVSDEILSRFAEYEDPSHTSAAGAQVELATFDAKNILACPEPKRCTWRPDPSLERLGLSQGPPFALRRDSGHWYVICVCGATVLGPIDKDRVRWLLTLLRLTVWAPQESEYVDTSSLTSTYLDWAEKQRAISRGAQAALSRGDKIVPWLAARDDFERDIALDEGMGRLSQGEYDELSQLNRLHADRLRSILSSGTSPSEDQSAEDLFPAAERDRIRRDYSTLLGLPPAVRGELAADMAERIERFLAALAPLKEHADHPVAQLYIGCLYYWDLGRIATSGTERERATMNDKAFTTSDGEVLVGYFSIAEHFLAIYQLHLAGGPAEQALFLEVDSWMKALRGQSKAQDEIRRWTT